MSEIAKLIHRRRGFVGDMQRALLHETLQEIKRHLKAKPKHMSQDQFFGAVKTAIDEAWFAAQRRGAD